MTHPIRYWDILLKCWRRLEWIRWLIFFCQWFIELSHFQEIFAWNVYKLGGLIMDCLAPVSISICLWHLYWKKSFGDHRKNGPIGNFGPERDSDRGSRGSGFGCEFLFGINVGLVASIDWLILVWGFIDAWHSK